MTDDTLRAILEAVHDHGPIRFDEFVELALYGPGGYYDRPPIGRHGDFVTSPHVHWWFAYALAAALGELHERLPEATPPRLVELGAGDGTLARQLLEILAEAGPIDYTAVERSAGARRLLARTGVRVASSLEEVGSLDRTLVFANELLDNLPFRRLRRTGDGLVEIRIGAEGGRLVEVEAEPERPLPESPLELEPGEEAVVPVGALALLDDLTERMRDAYALFVDYAAEGGAKVHGYRRHRVVGAVLQAPGSTDITAGVDIRVLERRAVERGLVVLGRVTQRQALLALGLDDWARAERDRGRNPAIDRGVAAWVWADRSRATLLADPSGLGAHRWLLLATPGRPPPPWLDRARHHPSTD